MPTKSELIWEGKYDAKGQRGRARRRAIPGPTKVPIGIVSGRSLQVCSAADACHGSELGPGQVEKE